MFGVQEDNYVVQSNRICFASMITTAKLDKDNHLSNLDNQEKYTNGNIALSDNAYNIFSDFIPTEGLYVDMLLKVIFSPFLIFLVKKIDLLKDF